MVKKALFHKIFLFIVLASASIAYFFHRNALQEASLIDSHVDSQEKSMSSAQECPISTVPSQETFVGNKSAGFTSVLQTTPLQKIEIQGALPSWLNGMFICTGPASFELGPTKAAYWFNGLALLHGFYFDGTTLSYQNNFLDSVYYQRCMKNGRFDSSMSTEKPKGFFSRLASAALGAPEPYDNGNLAIAQVFDKVIALTETTLGVQIDPVTLKTIRPFNLNDYIEGHLTTINFLYDTFTNAYYNYLINFGTTSDYVVYKIGEQGAAQQLITLPVKTPSYMRSMAMTKNYIILIEIPYVVNPMDLLLGAGAFIEKVQWKPELGTKFIVINKASGALVKTLHTTTPLLVFNTINAFEKNDELVLDFIAYNNANIIPYTKVESLQGNNAHEFEPSYYTRVKLNLTNSMVTPKQFCATTLASPTFNKTVRMEPYSFIYGISASQADKFPHKIVKINTQNGSILEWSMQGCYANEPTFVASPGATIEDDGILLSLVFDSIENKSFLLILAANSLQEVARAYLPTPVPLGVAGIFITKESTKV